MHLLSNDAPIPLGNHHGKTLGTLPPGEWMCHDQNAAELLLMAERGSAKMAHCGNRLEQRDGESVLFVRSGAIGDLLFLSPAIQAYKGQHPTARIALSCFPSHHEIVCDLGIELLPYPLPTWIAKDFDLIISLENLIEQNNTDHATDCFAEAIGVEVEDYRPIFRLTDVEQLSAQAVFPKTKRTRVGIQCLASVANRDYPLNQWMKVIELLTEKNNCEVFLFGFKDQLPPMKPGTVNVTNLSERGLSFRQSAAVLSTCDLFVGVDSALLPVCHALNIPAVGLYAAFDWKTRTSKAPQTWALTGLGECAPCNWLKKAGRAFPPNKPCSKVGVCTVLASITPERIVSKLMSLHHASAH